MFESSKDRKLIAYDCEVLSKCKMSNGMSYWSVVFIDYETGLGKIIKNDVEQLRKFIKANEDNIFVGYNCRGYDQYIIKGIILGMDAGFINDKIISEKLKGHQVVTEAWKIKFNNFDIMPNPPIGLKTMEAFMGSMIKESDVPFDIDRPLTKEEEKDLLTYNIHDVKETIKVLEHLSHEFEAQLSLIDAFNLDFKLFNKTKAQLSAHILGAVKTPDRGDVFDYQIPDTLIIEEHKHIVDWYFTEEGRNFKNKQEVELYGVPHTFSYGGLHGALKNYSAEGIILCCDVASLYPSIMINFNTLSRNVENPEKFKEIRDKRLIFKAQKNPIEQPLKIVINSTFGASDDQFNPLYDPRQAKSTCISGQLLLLDLIEKVAPYCELLQSNTDGIFMKVDSEELVVKIKEVAKEWELRHNLVLEWEQFSKIFQRDVNNYILVPEGELYNEKGKPRWKAKGGVVKHLSPIDYDLAVVNRAVVFHFLKGKPVEETINECNKLIDFQTICKLTSAYDEGAWYGCTFSKQPVLNEKTGKITKKTMWDEGSGYKLKDKTFRVFASTREEDGGLFKKKSGMNPAKFSNTSPKCFIDNGDVTDKECPEYLDRQFYIDLAKDRINQFLGIKKKPKKANKPKVDKKAILDDLMG